MTSPRSQPQYQVRFDWGLAGAAAVSEGAQVVVWADALRTVDAPDPTLLPTDAAILLGTVGNRRALAEWVLRLQLDVGDRVTVAVLAAGADDGAFAVEDLLAAGAVIDALADVGIDYLSPEAAAAVGAFVGLRNATGHVLSGSVTGQQILRQEHGREVLDAARAANSSAYVTVLRELVRADRGCVR